MNATGEADPVERELAGYARDALTPDAAAMRGIREALRREAQTRPRSGAPRAPDLRVLAGGAGATPAAPTRRSLRRGSSRRAVSALVAAALAGLVVGGTVLASARPGGPLYAARVWLEQVTLPADPDARLEAEIARAQTRLAEATEAGAAGDRSAIQAALDAYARIVEQTIDEGADAATGSERATLAFEHHRNVLEDLRDELAAREVPAEDAIAHALAQSSRAIARLGKADADPTRGRPDEPVRGPAPTTDPAPGASVEPTQRPGRRPEQPRESPPGRPEDPGSQGQGGDGGATKSNGGARPTATPASQRPGRGGDGQGGGPPEG